MKFGNVTRRDSIHILPPQRILWSNANHAIISISIILHIFFFFGVWCSYSLVLLHFMSFLNAHQKMRILYSFHFGVVGVVQK